MSIESPKNTQPPIPEQQKTPEKDEATETPESSKEGEVDSEQIEQRAEEAKAMIEQLAAEIVPEADRQIESSAGNMNVSPESLATARQEQNLDEQLAEVQSEASQLAADAKEEIRTVSADEQIAPEKEHSPESLDRWPNESRAAYLARSGRELTSLLSKDRGGIYFDPTRIQETAYSPTEQKLIDKTMAEARKEEVQEGAVDNAEAIEKISKSIGVHSKTPTNEAEFDTTRRDRKFFERATSGGHQRHETYWNTLFFPYNTESTRALAKEILDNKTIVLLGGGKAKLKAELQQNGINPREILNVDPFVAQAEEGADTVIPANATDERLPELLREHGIEKVEEIWAEYSVPAYLQDPNDIKKLFQNIDTLLAENGNARIWPIEVQPGEDADIEARKAALIEALKELDVKSDYEISSFSGSGRPGFTLHKLRKKELVES